MVHKYHEPVGVEDDSSNTCSLRLIDPKGKMNSDVSALSDAKRKLCALLDKVSGCIGVASNEVCEALFLGVAEFARNALAERDRRMQRTELVERELSPLAPVAKRVRGEEKVTPAPKQPMQRAEEVLPPLAFAGRCLAEEEKVEPLRFCKVCSKRYRNKQLCDGCDASFRWCCTGYSREPCEDPIYPRTGAKIMLQSFCHDCLEKKQLSTDRVLQQEEEYERILSAFSTPNCLWTWVPCLCDGCSVFAVTWVALEGLSFLESPFYCKIGTEYDNLESRTDPKFLEFVVDCAEQALLILAGEALLSLNDEELQDDARVQAWSDIKIHPAVPPRFAEADFDLAWKAVAACLNTTIPSRICIWKGKDGGLEHAESYGVADVDCAHPRIINVLRWNSDVFIHFDLLIPIEDVQEKYNIVGVEESEL
jgi:hypothetical protein